MRKFLVVNMNYMGDALLTTPALAALRQAYPDARIDTVVGAGAAAEVLQDNPDLDAHHRPHGAGELGALSCRRTGCCARGGTRDAVILPPLPAYAAAAWLARTPRRVGQAARHEPLPDRPAADAGRPHGRRDAGHDAALRRRRTRRAAACR